MNDTTTTTKFSFASRLLGWWAHKREELQITRLRSRCPPAWLAAAQIPPAVRAAWTAEAPAECPGLAVDDLGWLRCSVGFAQFLEACRLQQAQGPCALPSKAADSVWHVWLQVDPVGLATWQQRFFDRVVEHRESAELGAPLDDCLARTWAGATRSEGLSPLDQRLPIVFGLDGQLGLPSGWAYSFRRGQLVHRQIDGFGNPGGSFIEHPALASAGLVALGLVTAAEVEKFRQRSSDGGSSSSSDSSSSSSSSSTSDCSDGSSSSDGGCSCGSSCGSSCGGGGD